jgi:hypothetical protein
VHDAHTKLALEQSRRMSDQQDIDFNEELFP